MFKFLVLIAVLATVAARVELGRLDTFSFEDWVEKYHSKFSQGSSEWLERKAIFENEIVRVRSHNAKGLGWKETINHFSAMTEKEKKNFYGRNKSVKQSHNLASSIRPAHKDVELDSLPKNVDWRKAGIVSAVKDQGHCGSCWAFASTAVIESAVAKASGMLFDLSVQQMAMCAPNPDKCGGTGNCAGSTAELAFDYVAKSTGMVEEFMYGYGAYYGNVTSCEVPEGPPKASIGGYEQLPTNELKPFMNALYTEGPISISVDASTWHAYHSGIYDGCDASKPDIDHAVVAVGYGEDKDGKYWLVRNSWSASWGEAGYIRLQRGDDETKCGMDTTPQDGVACEGETAPLKTCGTCGILFDNAYPTDAKAIA